MTTPKERHEEQRREKLRQMEEQIRTGSLVVRQMTPEERERNPPRTLSGGPSGISARAGLVAARLRRMRSLKAAANGRAHGSPVGGEIAAAVRMLNAAAQRCHVRCR